MKFIHLSDLHLGKRVNEFSMLEDQAYILNQILQRVQEEKPDGILLAGDIYDKSVPPGEAVQLLDDFLTRLAEWKLDVFLISGNHDSAERIAFGGRLMRNSKIYISPVFDGMVEPVLCRDSWGEVRVYLLPFIKPAHVRRFYPEEEILTTDDAVKVVLRSMEADPACRNVLLCHQFITGGITCESEELSIGGLDQVDARLFDAFDYVALGHLHGPQKVLRDTICYSGTPLKYSFSEAGHRKSLTVVELAEKGQVQVRAVELTPRRDLRKLKGTYMELTARDYYRDMNREDYLYITLTDEDDIPDAMGRLRSIYPNLMKLDYDNARTRSMGTINPVQEAEKRSPLELFEGFYSQQNNQPMSQEQRQLVQELMEKIWEEEA